MGLAAAKNKRKWAKDPNNTAWSRNTDTFGQKLLRSQGWEPGQYLGAKDAGHSEFYGAANATHIRAVLKDDNLGLGARRNQGDECTGLSALQELLGRLNGKSEESLGAERKKREDARVNQYLERKLGTVRFVYGGLLVGDKVQQLADELKKEKEEKEAAAEGKKEKKKSKKRKAEAEEEEESASQQETSKDKKSKKRKTEDDSDESKSKRKEKKDKKRKEKETEAGSPSDENDNDEDTSSRKKSKKDKKEKRKKAKDDDGDDTNSAETSDAQTKEMRKKQKKEEKKRRAAEEEASKSTPVSTQTATPSASGTSTPTTSEVPYRHLARKRFIAQKRAAVLDPAALNQIFMIKA